MAERARVMLITIAAERGRLRVWDIDRISALTGVSWEILHQAAKSGGFF